MEEGSQFILKSSIVSFNLLSSMGEGGQLTINRMRLDLKLTAAGSGNIFFKLILGMHIVN